MVKRKTRNIGRSCWWKYRVHGTGTSGSSDDANVRVHNQDHNRRDRKTAPNAYNRLDKTRNKSQMRCCRTRRDPPWEEHTGQFMNTTSVEAKCQLSIDNTQPLNVPRCGRVEEASSLGRLWQ